MSIGNIGQTPLISTVSGWVKNWEALVKAHEKLVIVAILAFTGFHICSKGLDFWDKIDTRKVEQTKTIVESDVKTNSDLSKQIAAQSVAINSQKESDQKLITQLNAKIDAMTASQLAVKMGGTTIDPTTVTLPLDTAKHDEAQLEQIPTLQNELASEQNLSESQSQLIAGLQKQLVDSGNVCKAEVAAEKVKTRKAFLRGFKIGGVAGFIAGLIVGHHI